MKHPDIIKINESWYSHIQECGMQCQISFFFAKQPYQDVIMGVDDIFNKPFVSQVRDPLPFGITYESVMADLQKFRSQAWFWRGTGYDKGMNDQDYEDFMQFPEDYVNGASTAYDNTIKIGRAHVWTPVTL